MDRGHYASEKEVVDDLQKYAQRLSMYNIINHSETAYGYSRLDAFGRIYNRVLEHVITQAELKEQLNPDGRGSRKRRHANASRRGFNCASAEEGWCVK